MIGDSPCSPASYWIRDLKLMPEDKQLLHENRLLTDRILAAAELVMRNQFLEMPTPQPTVYAQAPHKLRPAEEGALFYHNFNNHWAVSQLSQGKCIIMTTYKISVSLQSCKSSISPSTPILRMVQHCKSSSYRCKFREAARTVGVLLSRLWFHFSWEMIQPP